MTDPQTNHEKYLQLELLQTCLKYMELGASVSEVLKSVDNVKVTVNDIFERSIRECL